MPLCVLWDATCDCEGCPGCKDDMPCGVAAATVLVDYKTEAIAEIRKDSGFSFSRRKGQLHVRCESCKGLREF